MQKESLLIVSIVCYHHYYWEFVICFAWISCCTTQIYLLLSIISSNWCAFSWIASTMKETLEETCWTSFAGTMRKWAWANFLLTTNEVGQHLHVQYPNAIWQFVIVYSCRLQVDSIRHFFYTRMTGYNSLCSHV